MTVRTVRLDKDTEKALFTITQNTGMSISDAIKQGLRMLKENLPNETKTPYEIYQGIELGPGNPDAPHAKDAHKVLRNAFKEKLHQRQKNK